MTPEDFKNCPCHARGQMERVKCERGMKNDKNHCL